MDLLILFIILNIFNVIIQTIKSIATIKCGKTIAALVNAVAFGLYTIVIVYTNCELDLWVKVAVVAGSNLIGVYVVKLIEEKARKEKIWRVDAAIKDKDLKEVTARIKNEKISCSVVPLLGGKYTKLEIYCENSKESLKIKQILKEVGAKYFVSETKVL